MSTHSGVRRIVAGFVLVTLLALWRLLAPLPVGGTVSYVITHGISMLPKYEAGDLVLVRKADRYAVGDVIAYRSANLDQPVLHRVVEAGDQGYVTKGDNNSWLDSDHPTDADVMGRTWAHLPGAGNWLAKARSPVGASLLLGLVALSFFVGNDRKRKRQPAGSGPPMRGVTARTLDPAGKTVVSVIAALSILFLALGIYVFSQPATETRVGNGSVDHVGAFSYHAEVPKSPVYPDGNVDPGQPIFLRLVDQLDVMFDYTLQSDKEATVSGEALVFARVTGASGWKKTVPVAGRTAVADGRAHLEGTLDLRSIRRFVNQVQTITGLPEAEQTVELVGRVAVEGEVASQPMSERFTPVVTFSMSAYQLQVRRLPSSDEEIAGGDIAAAPEDPLAFLRHTQPAELALTHKVGSKVHLLGASVPISSLRQISLIGFLIALGAMFVAWMRLSRPSGEGNEASRISARYGDWLIPVGSMRTESSAMVEVKSIEALARLAELYERMILHEEAHGLHSYYVEQEGTLYCFHVGRPAPPAPPLGSSPPPAPPPRNHAPSMNHSNREERRKEEAELLRQELTQIEAEVLRQKAGPKAD